MVGHAPTGRSQLSHLPNPSECDVPASGDISERWPTLPPSPYAPMLRRNSERVAPCEIISSRLKPIQSPSTISPSRKRSKP